VTEPTAQDRAAALDAEVLDAGARRLFNESWADLVADFARIGRTPSPDFVMSIAMLGALVLAKRANPQFSAR
jgi:hypothetical protein